MGAVLVLGSDPYDLSSATLDIRRSQSIPTSTNASTTRNIEGLSLVSIATKGMVKARNGHNSSIKTQAANSLPGHSVR